MRIDKPNLIRLIFAIWIILWMNFILRDLFVRKSFFAYKALIKKDKNGKASYVYGDSLYSFLKFSKKNLPNKTTYNLIGIKDLSLDYRRTVYYLYPLIESNNPDYILVFNDPGYKRKGYAAFAKLDDDRFILSKR